MAYSWFLLLVELFAFLMYLDLWLLNRRKVHIFTPLMKYIPKAKMKLQNFYQRSLNRDFFCVLDKIDVSGGSFTGLFSIVYITCLIGNMLQYPQDVSKFYYWHFNLIAYPYFIYLMFCLVCYRARRELCFYCTFGLLQNLLALVLMIVFYLDTFPYGYLTFSLLGFMVVVCIRALYNQ